MSRSIRVLSNNTNIKCQIIIIGYKKTVSPSAFKFMAFESLTLIYVSFVIFAEVGRPTGTSRYT